MKIIILACILAVIFQPINSADLIKNVGKSAIEAASGVAQKFKNNLPTSKGLFEIGKNLIAGYPIALVSSAINEICSAALASEKVTPKVTPDINKIKFQLRTPCDKHFFPVLNANDMWTSPDFDPKKKVVIFVNGWTSNVNESGAFDLFAQAYACRGDVNFVAVDTDEFIDTLYTWSAFNTEDLGKHIAVGLQQLIKILPVANIHLIGHSLGAHIVGYTGRYFQELTQQTIPHITGLDPAKPCFKGEALSGLLQGDADFVDIIHTNPGVLGKRDVMGNVDFYPGGLRPLPVGCLDVGCAHARSWKFYGETIYPGNENNFMAVPCTSLTQVREKKCQGNEVPMGYSVPKDAKGIYFLEVRAEEPFGLNGNTLDYKECAVCDKTKSQ